MPRNGDEKGPAPTCDRLWTTKEVAAFLGVPVTTLHRWRYEGKGPVAHRVGRHLRFRRVDTEKWLAEQRDVSVS